MQVHAYVYVTDTSCSFDTILRTYATYIRCIPTYCTTTGGTHSSSSSKQSYGYMHAQWSRRLYTAQGHFEYTEKVLALREVMLRVLCAEDMSSSSANEASLTTSISRLTSHIRGIVDTSREANNHT
jgi:hypothetical protein